MLNFGRNVALFVVLMVMGSCGAYHKNTFEARRLPASAVESLDRKGLLQQLNLIYLHQVLLEKHQNDKSRLKELRIKVTTDRKRQLEFDLIKRFSQHQDLEDELESYALQSSLHARSLQSLLPGKELHAKPIDLEQTLVVLSRQREFQVAEKNIEHMAYMLE